MRVPRLNIDCVDITSLEYNWSIARVKTWGLALICTSFDYNPPNITRPRTWGPGEVRLRHSNTAHCLICIVDLRSDRQNLIVQKERNVHVREREYVGHYWRIIRN